MLNFKLSFQHQKGDDDEEDDLPLSQLLTGRRNVRRKLFFSPSQHVLQSPLIPASSSTPQQQSTPRISFSPIGSLDASFASTPGHPTSPGAGSSHQLVTPTPQHSSTPVVTLSPVLSLDGTISSQQGSGLMNDTN